MPLHRDDKEVVAMQMEGVADVISKTFINDYELNERNMICFMANIINSLISLWFLVSTNSE